DACNLSASAVYVAHVVASSNDFWQDVPSGQWVELLPTLERWCAEEGQAQIAALRIMGFWAEEWWQSFVCEQGGQEIRTTVLRMLKACLRLLTCLPTGGIRENQLVAAETVFQLLGCARDVLGPDDALSRELLDALVLACRTALLQCHQLGQSPSELTELDQLLASATLRCLGRLATESVTVLSPNLCCVAPTVLQSMQGTPSAVSIIAVEFWSSLALHDIAAASCGTYAGEGLVAEFLPQLVPLLLAMLAASDAGRWSDQQLVEAASVSLQLLVKADKDEFCIQQIFQFLSRSHASSQIVEPGFGDLLALDALLEAREREAAEAVGLFCPLVSAAMVHGNPSWRIQAAKTATRALQMQKECIPHAVKESWLQTSLVAIRDESMSFDFGQVLQELMSQACASPKSFEILAGQLLAAFEEVPPNSPARPALLRALAGLIESSSCEPFLGALLLKFLDALQKCRHIDGAGGCLKALTLRLGPAVLEFADRLLQFCASRMLDSTVQEEGLLATVALVKALGKSHPSDLASLWPVVARVLAKRDQPEALNLVFEILQAAAETLEPRHLLPLAAQAVPGLLSLLEDSSQQAAAAECLSTLAAALGADAPHLEALVAGFCRQSVAGMVLASTTRSKHDTCYSHPGFSGRVLINGWRQGHGARLLQKLPGLFRAVRNITESSTPTDVGSKPQAGPVYTCRSYACEDIWLQRQGRTVHFSKSAH
ncbi:unnamed protein product, partial [Symbiodinium necroappetens]